MGRKSTITRLPAPVRTAIDDALKDGTQTLDEIIAGVRAHFAGTKYEAAATSVKRSPLGRYSQRFEEIGKRMRAAREVSEIWATTLGKDPNSKTGRLVTELLRTLAYEVGEGMAEVGEDGKLQLDASALNMLSLAHLRIETAAKRGLEQDQQMREALAQDVEKKLTSDNAPRKLDKETLAFVRQAIREG